MVRPIRETSPRPRKLPQIGALCSLLPSLTAWAHVSASTPSSSSRHQRDSYLCYQWMPARIDSERIKAPNTALRPPYKSSATLQHPRSFSPSKHHQAGKFYRRIPPLPRSSLLDSGAIGKAELLFLVLNSSPLPCAHVDASLLSKFTADWLPRPRPKPSTHGSFSSRLSLTHLEAPEDLSEPIAFTASAQTPSCSHHGPGTFGTPTKSTPSHSSPLARRNPSPRGELPLLFSVNRQI
jgi:hypothetical protein